MMVLTITRVSGDNVCYITCITCLHDMTSIRCYYIITCPAWFLSSVPPGCGQCRLRSPAGPSPSGSSSYNIVLFLYCHCIVIVLYDHGRGLLVPDVVVLDRVGQLVAPVPSVEEAAGAGARPVTLVADIIMVYTV